MFEEIAIIGQGCLIPGCHTVEQFMNIIKEGQVTISSPPEGYWRVELDELTCEEKSNLPPVFPFVDKGGYIRDFELLPEEYKLDRNMIEQLDVVFKWSLYSAGEALKNSGYLNNRTAMKRTGIVIGNSASNNSSFTKLSEEIYLKELLEARNTEIHPYNRFASGLPARLIKKAFGTGGNAFAIDAACASSLYVLKLACDLLQRKETDIMLAGAVCALDSFLTHINFSALQALSPSGLCKPFNMNSDGIIPSEGSAFVVLKRLKDAIRDGNNISGVIRAIGMSNDGRSGGFLAPSIEGQISAMNYAYKMSGIEPGEISYIECHATGTRVGDLREIQSLLKIFPDGIDLPVGSIKANVGHLFAASGMASLIKLLGMFKDEFIPVTPNAHPVLPEIRDSHLRVPEKNEYWNKERKIGAISNFGFGGSNGHLILEEWKKGHSKIHQIEKLPVKTAVTGLGVITHCTESLQEFTDLIYGRINSSNKKIDKVNFTSGEIAFPPGDLKKALGQQLLMLKAADEATGQVKILNKESTGVFIGVQTDPGSIITDLSDKLTYYLKKSNSHENSSEEKRNKFISSADTADVIGKMSHINATRINNQYNLKGYGFSVFCEELSGDCALDIAIKAIEQGEIDSAIVGAVDLSMEPVQKFAAEKSLPEKFRSPASAAVAMVLKRLDDAEKDKDTIYAIISSCEYMENDRGEKNYSPGNNSDDFNLTTILGHSHAASGLLHIAAGIIILNNQSLPFDKKNISLMSKNGKKEIEILNETFIGGYYKTVMTGEASVKLPERAESKKPFLTFPLYKHIDTSLLEDFKKKVLSKRREKAGEVKISRGRVMEKAPELAPVYDIFFSGKNIPGQIEILKENKSVQHPETSTELQVNGFKENKSVQHGLLNLVIRNHTNMMEAQNQFLHNQLKAYNAFMNIESAMKNYLSGINIAHDGYKTIESNIYGESFNNGYKTIEPVNLSKKSSSNLLTEKKKDLFEPAVFRKPSGPSFSGKDLEILASGNISTVFGKLFEQQDMYELQIRPPAPPFLLCDRITGIEGEAGSMGTGTIWTETDVKEDSWYLCNRMMPGAIFYESCRGILFLASWLGLDFLNKGKSVFRLLGAERIFYGNLPSPGETLQFQVCIDDHTVYGNRRLLFYHYDCRINGKVRMSVRNGQGGFFTHEELKNSKGVIWAPETASYTENPGLHIPVNFCKKTHFTREEVKSYFERNGYDCFKEGFEILKTHKRSPVSLVGNSYFIEEITKFDPSGGPEKRGYLCGRSSVKSDWWFFKVHFKNDPCMPGAFMWEGCIQLMSFYLAALGFTGKHDGWRFEPVPWEKTKSMFRSQVTPDSKEIFYEIFIDEIIGEPCPAIYAHGLVTVDGVKAFCCERMGLRLIADETDSKELCEFKEKDRELQDKSYSLSEGQKGLWFLNKSNPDDLSYNIPVAFKINEYVNIERLKSAVKLILEKHELFLSKFKLENYELCRLIDGEVKINIKEEDIAAGSNLEEAIESLKKYIIKPFNLEKAPLVRTILCKYSGNNYILLFVFHHIIFDGTSLPVIINEIMEVYNSGGKDLAFSNNYEDFVIWQKDFLCSKKGEKQLSYWKKELSGELPQINLPVKNKITSIKNNSGCYIFDLNRESLEKIKELSLKEKVTFFSVIYSAFKILLFKYTQQEDLITGTLLAGRPDRRFKKTAGYFVNPVAIRSGISEKMPVKDFLMQINKKVFDGLLNGNYPFSRLVSELNIKRENQRNPLFQILFVFQNWVKYFDQKLNSLKLEMIPKLYPATDYHINLEIYEESARGYLTYNANLFDEEIMKQMGKHYNKILTEIPVCFDKNIEDIDILSEEERNRILYEFNDTYREYPKNKTIQELFEEQAEKTPDKIATVYEDKKLTYRELNSKVNQLAGLLRNKGIKSDTVVAIAVEPSLEMIISVMAVLKSGAAYVPVDPYYPIKRINFIFYDTDVKVLLSQKHLSERIKFNGLIINTDDDRNYHGDTSNIPIINRPSDSACIIYTSGTTGEPKGVIVSHSSLTHFCLWYKDLRNLNKRDNTTKVASFSFDVTIWEVFPSLISGATLHIISNNIKFSCHRLNEYYEENNITVSFLPTQMGEQFIEFTDNRSLRWLDLAGEKLRNFKKRNYTIVNGYGPVEYCDCITYFIVDKYYDNIPIGKPLWNTKVYILTPSGRLKPAGVTGDLYVSGEGLAKGYLNRESLTEEKFIENPFIPGQKMYKTGDLARWLFDGNIEFMGRMDKQVKIRGFRIEPGEIEQVILQQHPIRDAAVIDYEDNEGHKYLCAYIVSDREINNLKRDLSEYLPDFMIPSYIIQVEKIPLTPNGKIDRSSLPLPDLDRSADYVPPQDDMQRKLVEIWEEVLRTKPVGIRDDFFKMGGNSILAIKLFAIIHKNFNKDLPLSILLDGATVEYMSLILREKEIPGKSLVAVNPHGTKPPFYCVTPVGGESIFYSELSKYLGKDQPFYGLQIKMEEFTSIEELASRYIKEIEVFQNKVPYYLGGFSSGGTVAFEMALQLHRKGYKVGALVIFDNGLNISWTPWFILKLICYFPRWLINFFKESSEVKENLISRGIKRGKIMFSSIFKPCSRPATVKDIVDVEQVLKFYIPEDYPGRIMLFRSSKKPLIYACSYDSEMGWGKIAGGGVKVKVIPDTGHKDIFKEPQVKILARELQEYLDTLQKEQKDKNNG